MTDARPVFLIAALVLLGLVLASGCTSPVAMTPVTTDIKKFNSTGEIEQYLKNSYAQSHEGGKGGSMLLASAVDSVGISQGASSAGRESLKSVIPAAAPVVSGATEYSTTNIQVEGVDEPDIVKNDGRYIYLISGSTLAIIDTYPAENAKIISKTEISDTPQDLFVSGNRLVLFTNGWESGGEQPVSATDGIASMPVSRIRSGGTSVADAWVYDITDRQHPVLVKDYSIDGRYIDSRLIGQTLYMVTREEIYPYDDRGIIVPVLREGTKPVIQPDVWYFDNPETQYTFTTITALDINNGAEKDAQTYLLGSGNILYVSPDALYVSYQKYHPVVYPARGVGAVVPMPVSVAEEKVSTAAMAVPADFNTLDEAQRQSLIESLRNGEEEAARAREVEQTSTVIHKIGIDNGKITYIAKGEVPGTLDNQFSMDEYKGDLRVATTSSVYTRSGQYTYNNVFVLDNAMKRIGTLTHIAEQETIYSTRFIGDRLYMVTFKRIDPFFVIDLSNPEKPAILGKLKIPGYSDYLHPYDATHIIGIGKETTTNDWGGVSTSGVKIALFDVSDVSRPTQIDKVQIGDAGSDSAALTDHHAFLFDREKNLLVIPMHVVSSVPYTAGDSYKGTPRVWYGAYVFGLTPESGFTLKGTIPHGYGDNRYYYYGSSNVDVRRALYIDNTLYTISQKQVKANSLEDLNTTISTILLPGAGDVYYPTAAPFE